MKGLLWIPPKLVFLVAPQKGLETNKIITQRQNKEGSMCDSQKKKIKLLPVMTTFWSATKSHLFLLVPLPLNTERIQTLRGQDIVPEAPIHSCQRNPQPWQVHPASLACFSHHPQPCFGKAEQEMGTCWLEISPLRFPLPRICDWNTKDQIYYQWEE